MFPLGVGSISTDARVDVVATRGPSSPWVDVFDAVDRTAQVSDLVIRVKLNIFREDASSLPLC